MSAAGFVLAINIFVSGLFAAAFGTIAWRQTSSGGARWLALAYGMGILNAALEFVLPTQEDARLLSLVVFSVALSAFLFCAVGLCRHYNVQVPWWLLAVLGLGSLGANVLTFELAHDSFLRAVVYQTPYFLAHLLGAWVVFKSRRRGALDITLLVFLLVSGLQFVAKPFLADAFGDGGAQNYLHSLYGAYSQVLTAFLLITNGLLMLLIIVRDVMAEITERSETDKLSGLLNRRGFEDRANRAVTQAMRTHTGAMVVADLDLFKDINDTFGHDAGDQVITAFGRVLAAAATPATIVGRLGGEEFAAFLPGGTLATARQLAETARAGIEALAIASLGPDRQVTASFGVAPLISGDTLSELLRRADAALYDAKKSGRNRVCVTQAMEIVVPPALPNDRRRGSRQR